MTKAEFKKMFPEIKNPTQEQIKRAIMKEGTLRAFEKSLKSLHGIIDQYSVDVRGFFVPYVKDNLVEVDGQVVDADTLKR